MNWGKALAIFLFLSSVGGLILYSEYSHRSESVEPIANSVGPAPEGPSAYEIAPALVELDKYRIGEALDVSEDDSTPKSEAAKGIPSEHPALISDRDAEAYRQLHESDSKAELLALYSQFFKDMPVDFANDLHLQELKAGAFEQIQGPQENKTYTMSSSDMARAMPFISANHVEPNGSVRRTFVHPDRFGGYTELVRHAIWTLGELRRRNSR